MPARACLLHPRTHRGSETPNRWTQVPIHPDTKCLDRTTLHLGKQRMRLSRTFKSLYKTSAKEKESIKLTIRAKYLTSQVPLVKPRMKGITDYRALNSENASCQISKEETPIHVTMGGFWRREENRSTNFVTICGFDLATQWWNQCLFKLIMPMQFDSDVDEAPTTQNHFMVQSII
ncbi:hypothetical protein Tco_1475887 [Tanacetum coccineum]